MNPAADPLTLLRAVNDTAAFNRWCGFRGRARGARRGRAGDAVARRAGPVQRLPARRRGGRADRHRVRLRRGHAARRARAGLALRGQLPAPGGGRTIRRPRRVCCAPASSRCSPTASSTRTTTAKTSWWPPARRCCAWWPPTRPPDAADALPLRFELRRGGLGVFSLTATESSTMTAPRTSIAVVGAGAVGSYYGALLARAGHARDADRPRRPRGRDPRQRPDAAQGGHRRGRAVCTPAPTSPRCTAPTWCCAASSPPTPTRVAREMAPHLRSRRRGAEPAKRRRQCARRWPRCCPTPCWRPPSTWPPRCPSPAACSTSAAATW